MWTRAFFHCENVAKGSHYFPEKKNSKFFEYYKSMPNIKICLNEVKRFNKVTKLARSLILRFLDYLSCTCKIPGQDHFWM